jgi:type IV fimbrial biogenesis protein FimT
VSIAGANPRMMAGFTLIELMIVISVAGVLLGVAVPSFRDGLLSNRAKAVASDIHLSFLMARSEALKRSANIDIVATGGNWTNGWMVEIQSDGTDLRGNDASNGVAIACGTSPSSTSGACDTTITFSRNGRPTEYTEFRTYIPDKANIQARCVSISLSGQPRVTTDTDSDQDNGCN